MDSFIEYVLEHGDTEQRHCMLEEILKQFGPDAVLSMKRNLKPALQLTVEEWQANRKP